MKKIICLYVTAAFILTLIGCNAGKRSDLIGDWILVSGEDSRFGRILRFQKDGELLCVPNARFSVDIDIALENSKCYFTVDYKIKTNAIKLTVIVFEYEFKMTVSYALEKDTLVFDGSTYARRC